MVAAWKLRDVIFPFLDSGMTESLVESFSWPNQQGEESWRRRGEKSQPRSRIEMKGINDPVECDPPTIYILFPSKQHTCPEIRKSTASEISEGREMITSFCSQFPFFFFFSRLSEHRVQRFKAKVRKYR